MPIDQKAYDEATPLETPLQNAKHEDFANYYADTDRLMESYRKAYNNYKSTDISACKSGAVVLKRPEVIARIKGIRKTTEEMMIWTRKDAILVLGEIAKRSEVRKGNKIIRKGARDSDRINAVKELNAMHGFSGSYRVDHSSSDGTMTPRGLDAFYSQAAISQAIEESGIAPGQEAPEDDD